LRRDRGRLFLATVGVLRGPGLGVVEATIADGSFAGIEPGPRYATLIPIVAALIALAVMRRADEVPE